MSKTPSNDEQKQPKQKKSKVDKQQQGYEREIANLTEDLKRVQADFVNYKRRAEEERVSTIEYGQKKAVLALLPTIDNIQRALNHIPDDLKDNDWAKGVQKVSESLLKDLNKLGVEPIGEANEEFDPELHEAVSVEGEGETETVAEVLQTGFTLNGKVIRHAIVKVKNS